MPNQLYGTYTCLGRIYILWNDHSPILYILSVSTEIATPKPTHKKLQHIYTKRHRQSNAHSTRTHTHTSTSTNTHTLTHRPSKTHSPTPLSQFIAMKNENGNRKPLTGNQFWFHPFGTFSVKCYRRFSHWIPLTLTLLKKNLLARLMFDVLCAISQNQIASCFLCFEI